MSLRRKFATVLGVAALSSFTAGMAAFGPAFFGWFVLALVIIGSLAFLLWSAWDCGYDTGWMDHSEGKVR